MMPSRNGGNRARPRAGQAGVGPDAESPARGREERARQDPRRAHTTAVRGVRQAGPREQLCSCAREEGKAEPKPRRRFGTVGGTWPADWVRLRSLLLPRCARTNPLVARARDEAGGRARHRVRLSSKGEQGTARRHANCPPSAFAHCDACPRRLGGLVARSVVPDPDGWVSRASAPPVSRIGRRGRGHREGLGVGRIVLSVRPSVLLSSRALQDCLLPVAAVPNESSTVTTGVCVAWHCLCWKHSSLSTRFKMESNFSYYYNTKRTVRFNRLYPVLHQASCSCMFSPIEFHASPVPLPVRARHARGHSSQRPDKWPTAAVKFRERPEPQKVLPPNALLRFSHTHARGSGTTPDSAGPPPTARIFIGSSGHLSFVVLQYTTRTRLRPPTATSQPRPSVSGSELLGPVPSAAAALRSFVLCPRGRLTKQSVSAAQQDTSDSHQRQEAEARPEQAHPVMSTSSTNSAAAASPAVSGLDYDDTALTLALPGSSSSADPTADRKRAAHAGHHKPPSPKYVLRAFVRSSLASTNPPAARVEWTRRRPAHGTVGFC